MKVIISQDGQQVFACGANAIFNVSTVDMPVDESGKGKRMYSVGIGGVSFGQFATLASAVDVLKKLTDFLINQRFVKFVVPVDPAPDNSLKVFANGGEVLAELPGQDDAEDIAAAYMALKEEMDTEAEADVPPAGDMADAEKPAESDAELPAGDHTDAPPKDTKKGRNSGR